MKILCGHLRNIGYLCSTAEVLQCSLVAKFISLISPGSIQLKHGVTPVVAGKLAIQNKRNLRLVWAMATCICI